MVSIRGYVLALTLLCFMGSASVSEARGDGTRQYYGNWSTHSSGKYSYRPYYYKPTASYVGYKHHYVIHVPSRPNHNYFYNPYTKKFWGRCPSTYKSETATYSMLSDKDRHGDLSKIAEDKFPPPSSTLPAIPESSDGQPIDLPPDDLPALDSLPSIGP